MREREYDYAIQLAAVILDEPNQDPDSDLSTLARQLLRALVRTDDLLAALRAARARLALVFGPDRDPRDDATVREIDAAIERATGQ